ncbi:MAG: peroxiredoxin-like family protein [Bacteroidota bacterium]
MKILLLFVFSFVLSQLAIAQEKPEGLFLNSKAFDFKAKDQSGLEISLKELRKKGNVVVLFYRGNWCPYCNRELKRFQDSLDFITAKGATVVAITPEGKEGVDSTIAKTGAVFSILTDEGMIISKKYGVQFKVEDRTVGRYKNAGVDLLKLNNQKEAALPVPAVYIVNKDGAVTFRYFNEDYRRRVSVKEILDAIK